MALPQLETPHRYNFLHQCLRVCSNCCKVLGLLSVCCTGQASSDLASPYQVSWSALVILTLQAFVKPCKSASVMNGQVLLIEVACYVTRILGVYSAGTKAWADCLLHSYMLEGKAHNIACDSP